MPRTTSASPLHRASKLGRRLWGPGLVAASIALSSLVFPTPSWALGNTSLNNVIIADPMPTLSELPTNLLQLLERDEVHAVAALGQEKVIAAVNGWRGAHSELLVVLVGLKHRLSGRAGQAGIRSAVSSACGAALASATSTRSRIRNYPSIPGGKVDYCSGVAAGKRVNVATVSWLRADVMAMMLAVNLPRGQVRTFSVEQAKAIPATGVPVP